MQNLSKQTVCIHKRLLLRNPLGISALVRDTLRPIIEKTIIKKGRWQFIIRYYDEHGNRLNIRTELDDALDKLYDELDKLTPEERRAWYIKGLYAKPLKYVQEIENTTYLVRTEFNKNADSTVYDTVERITSKDI